MNNKICFVVPFYGSWPNYAKLWALSAKFNPNIHFLIVTDIEIPYSLGPNIRLLIESYDNTMSRLSTATGIDSTEKRYHKLCDYKPFYGLAFKDELRQFEYWGYTDIDIILGDFSQVIQIINETKCDFFFTHTKPIGHCTIIRNSDKCNKVGLSVKNYKQRLLSSKHSTHLSESTELHEAIKENGLTTYSIQDLKNEWKKYRPIVSVSIDSDHSIYDFGYKNNFIIHCEENKVTAYCLENSLEKKEIIYIHFMGTKARRYWKKIDYVNSYPFSLTPYGLEPGLIDVNKIHSLHFKLKSYCYAIPSILYETVRSFVHTLFPKEMLPDFKQLKEFIFRKLKKKSFK